jgi:hypothetical protein
MLFANIYYAIHPIIKGDFQAFGKILTTLYAPQPNSTEVFIQIGNTTITLNSTEISNTNYLNTSLNQLSDQQFYVLVFDVFDKIFESYSLPSPPGYESLLDELGDGQLPDNLETFVALLATLLDQFLIAAISYLVSCVVIIF